MNADVLTNTIDCGEVRWVSESYMTEEQVKASFFEAVNTAGLAFQRGNVQDEYVLLASTGDAIRIMETLPNYVIEAPQQEGDFVRVGHLDTRPVLTGPVGFLDVVVVTPDQARRCTVKMFFA